MTRSIRFPRGTALKSKARASRATRTASRVSLTVVLLSGLCSAQEKIQQQRQEILNAILTTDSHATATQQRWVCINGNEPSRVKEARAIGMDFTPDASDSCLAAFQRSAKDRSLSEPYKKLLAQTGGDITLAETLPKAVGAAVLDGNAKVPIGKGKAITPTAPMAFDAGFVVAYSSAVPNRAGDPKKLKSVADSCLAAEKDAGTCFSVGYVYGAQAFNAR